MQACHFWIFSSRLVLACLQTGCGKSPQKSLKAACPFISLDLFSVSLGVAIPAKVILTRVNIENFHLNVKRLPVGRISTGKQEAGDRLGIPADQVVIGMVQISILGIPDFRQTVDGVKLTIDDA